MHVAPAIRCGCIQNFAARKAAEARWPHPPEETAGSAGGSSEHGGFVFQLVHEHVYRLHFDAALARGGLRDRRHLKAREAKAADKEGACTFRSCLYFG